MIKLSNGFCNLQDWCSVDFSDQILTMDSGKIFICFTFTTLLFAYTQAATPAHSPPSPIILTPTPAPAPAPTYVNLTDLLSVAGPFSTFLKYLESTKVIETLQNQANNTDEGITLFILVKQPMGLKCNLEIKCIVYSIQIQFQPFFKINHPSENRWVVYSVQIPETMEYTHLQDYLLLSAVNRYQN